MRLILSHEHRTPNYVGQSSLVASPWLATLGQLVQEVIGYQLLTKSSDTDQSASSEDEEYKTGDVIEVQDGRATTEEQRHMTNEQEVEKHVQEKQEQRAADPGRSRTTRTATHKPHQRDT